MADTGSEARLAARAIMAAIASQRGAGRALWATCSKVSGSVATVTIDGDDHATECRMLSGAQGLAAGRRCRVTWMGQEPMVQDYLI